VRGALYVIQQHDYSGAEIMHLSLLTGDPDALVACAPGSRTQAWLHEHGVATAPLRFRSLRHSGGPVETIRSVGRGVRSALELRRLIRTHPDRRLVYCISLRPGLLAALATTGLRRRVMWYVTDFVPPGAVGALTRLLAMAGCDAAVATSEAVRLDFVRRSRRLGRRTRTITPGVDPARFDASRAAPGEPRIAILGHISPTKRTDIAIDVAGIVGSAVPELEMEILGRAQFRDEDFAFERDLRARVAADPQLARSVVFRGYTEDVAAALGRFGVFLHCRPDEPFGVAVVEAMAAGLPVVAPAAAGPAEIVEHDRTGLLYPPGDAQAAARQVMSLLEDRQLARRLGSAARESVLQRFDETRQLGRLAALVEEEAGAAA
jgi:glycosyltransferase involved in cell wall biosynthesis